MWRAGDQKKKLQNLYLAFCSFPVSRQQTSYEIRSFFVFFPGQPVRGLSAQAVFGCCPSPAGHLRAPWPPRRHSEGRPECLSVALRREDDLLLAKKDGAGRAGPPLPAMQTVYLRRDEDGCPRSIRAAAAGERKGK